MHDYRAKGIKGYGDTGIQGYMKKMNWKIILEHLLFVSYKILLEL